MEDNELKNLWQQYDKSLEKVAGQNLTSIGLEQIQKSKSKIISLVPQKLLGIVLGIPWVLFLGYILYYTLPFANIFFIISAGAIAVITSIALVAYLIQLVLILRINFAESITATQKRLAFLQSSTINIVRISILQLPFYTTFYLNYSMFENASSFAWKIQVAVILTFVFITYWLYKNISYKNKDKKWFKVLFGGSGWIPVMEAREFMQEVEEFKS